MELHSTETEPAGRREEPSPHATYRPPVAAHYNQTWTPQEGWALGLPHYLVPMIPTTIPAIIAIGGGKGGVGKSMLSANLAARLGQTGRRVLLVDMDIGGSNLHTYFNVDLSGKTLGDFVLRRNCTFDEIPAPTALKGVYLVSGGKDEGWIDALNCSSEIFTELWGELLRTRLRAQIDCVIFDLGAGSHGHTMEFFAGAHMGIVTVLPEPTSIENAYGFLKAYLARLIQHVAVQTDQEEAGEEIKSMLFKASPSEEPQSHLQKLLWLSQMHPQLIKRVFFAMRARKVGFVVNQITCQRDVDVGSSMGFISSDYFGFNTVSLGHINHDEVAWKALRSRKLAVMHYPHSLMARCVHNIAQKATDHLGI